MKKLLFSLAFVATDFAFGQITLDHSFADNEDVYAFSKDTDMFYVSKVGTQLKIYNANFSLIKTVNVPMPTNYDRLIFWYSAEECSYSISKHIFNIDDKLEFLVEVYDTSGNFGAKLLLINDDGTLLKDFHSTPLTKSYAESFEIFHDSVNNINKLLVHNRANISNDQTDVYSLPTSNLTSKEIKSKNKLTAFPIPTSKILNIYNPKNNVNKVEIFDATGKLVISKSFNSNEEKITINVENLTKGNYIYKIGDLASKFIKE